MKRLSNVLLIFWLFVFVMMVPQANAKGENDGNPCGGALNYGEYGRATTLDPITSNDMISLRISELLFNGLVGIDEKQEIVPELAEQMEISDDGRGFRLEDVRDKGGMGLITMQERAERLGGRLTILSTPGQGTRIMASIKRET